MSDWDDWERQVSEAIPVSELFDPLDIDDYFEYYTPEIETMWDNAPTGDMTEGMLEHFVDMLIDMAETFDADMWEDFFEEWDGDFWEWYRENY